MPATAVPTQPIGLLTRAHPVTSLPPIETVINPMWPLCCAMNAVAAAICVVVGYVLPPAVCGRTAGHPMVVSREVVVAPAQPKFARVRWVCFATYVA